WAAGTGDLVMKLTAGAALLLMVVGSADAQELIKVGVVFPLSGNAASAGQSAKAAVELATDIMNGTDKGYSNIPLGGAGGLPNLGGAKIALVVADTQGDPSVGQSQTLRLITQDHVVAITGGYQSSVTLTASAVAERYNVPYV